MRFKKLRDILESIADCHRASSRFFSASAESEIPPRSRLLTDYLVEYEEARALALFRVVSEQGVEILDKWIKNIEMDPPSPDSALERGKVTTDLDSLVAAEVGIRESLINYYDHLIEKCEEREVKNILISLKTQEERGMRRFVRHAQGLADL